MGLMGARVIGIDVGTSGVRAVALAEDGGTVALAAVVMTAFGDATTPATWWNGVRAVISELGSSCDLSQVHALAVDGTSGTMVAVDRVGEPVGRARMYDEPCNDEAVLRAIAEYAPAESAARGATSALARVLMMQGRPNVRHMLHQADWISGKLSGRFDRSDWNNALKTGYDPVAARWPEWIGRTGADLTKLPVVLEPGAPIGPVKSGRRGSWHTGISDRARRNDGRLRLVPRDRRLRGWRRSDRARIDACCQASVRPPNLRSGVWNLQSSDWLQLARWGRLEYRRQGHRAVLSAAIVLRSFPRA